MARGDEIAQHGETTVIRPNDTVAIVEYTTKLNYLPGIHCIVFRDITRRKMAEEQVHRNLALAQAASAEADALRASTLALTQNLSMDYVLDTLLESLVRIVPCESAAILLCETESRLFVARELETLGGGGHVATGPSTLRTHHDGFIAKVSAQREVVIISDTNDKTNWKAENSLLAFRSWLGVPLVASNEVLGLLSLGDSHPNAFSEESVRLAKSLAIPAAVAIQNARLYERASIYAIELEQRLADLNEAQKALRVARDKCNSLEND